MTVLPLTLRPWEPELRSLARDLALALGDLVPRIAALLGPIRGSSHDAEGDPDGYDGIASRGPVTRLLTTEWLLATELPDEFLRRASMGEHMFLALARTQSRKERTLTALFDAGPTQLGAPRVVQLALLVVLAQRARRARAVFRWGILQTDAAPFTGLEPASVRAFLAARTVREPTADDRVRWHGCLDPGEEQWIVAGTAFATLNGRAGTLVLEDDPDPDKSAVILRRVTGARTTELRLDLPSSQQSARLLRDPFSEPSRAQRAPDSFLGARIAFSSDGRRLLVRLRSGRVLGWPIPNSPRASPGSAASYKPPPNHAVVGADWRRGQWHVVTQARGTLRVHVLGKNGGNVEPPRSSFSSEISLDEPGEEASFAPLVTSGSVLTFEHSAGPLEIVHTVFRRSRAVATARSGDVVVSLVPAPDDARVLQAHNDANVERHRELLPGTGDGAIRTGFGPRSAHPILGLLGVRTEPGRWRVYTKAGPVFVDHPRGFSCVGLAEDGALVGFFGGRSELLVLASGYNRTIATASGPIVEGCASDRRSCVAYATAAGEVVVQDLEGVVLLRLFGALE